jgi:hypothetical protein
MPTDFDREAFLSFVAKSQASLTTAFTSAMTLR